MKMRGLSLEWSDPLSLLDAKAELDQYLKKHLDDTDQARVLSFLMKFKSHHTRVNYKRDLFQFFQFLSQCGKRNPESKNMILQVNSGIARMWWQFLLFRYSDPSKVGNQFVSKTMDRKLACVRSFFSYCVKQKYIEKNPFLVLKKYRANALNPSPILNKVEWKRIFEESPFHGKEPIEIKETSFIKLCIGELCCKIMLSTGLRISELRELKLEHFCRPINGAFCVTLNTKGAKERTIFLPNQVIKWVEDFIKLTQFYFQDRSDYLLQISAKSKNHKKISSVSIWRCCRFYLREIRCNPKVTPHGLRATFASGLNRRNVSIIQIQRLLGHQRVSTTQNYLRTAEETHIDGIEKGGVYLEDLMGLSYK